MLQGFVLVGVQQRVASSADPRAPSSHLPGTYRLLGQQHCSQLQHPVTLLQLLQPQPQTQGVQGACSALRQLGVMLWVASARVVGVASRCQQQHRPEQQLCFKRSWGTWLLLISLLDQQPQQQQVWASCCRCLPPATLQAHTIQRQQQLQRQQVCRRRMLVTLGACLSPAGAVPLPCQQQQGRGQHSCCRKSWALTLQQVMQDRGSSSSSRRRSRMWLLCAPLLQGQAQLKCQSSLTALLQLLLKHTTPGAAPLGLLVCPAQLQQQRHPWPFSSSSSRRAQDRHKHTTPGVTSAPQQQ